MKKRRAPQDKLVIVSTNYSEESIYQEKHQVPAVASQAQRDQEVANEINKVHLTPTSQLQREDQHVRISFLDLKAKVIKTEQEANSASNSVNNVNKDKEKTDPVNSKTQPVRNGIKTNQEVGFKKTIEQPL